MLCRQNVTNLLRLASISLSEWQLCFKKTALGQSLSCCFIETELPLADRERAVVAEAAGVGSVVAAVCSFFVAKIVWKLVSADVGGTGAVVGSE